MAQIFRVERTKNFTVMSNHHFKNKNLTLKAKGLLSWYIRGKMSVFLYFEKLESVIFIGIIKNQI